MMTIKPKMRPPFTYYGGKQKLTDIILPLIPEHAVYTEPFAGGAAIFFAKTPVATETLNDTNEALINFYKVVKNDFAALDKKVKDTPCSRRLYHTAWVIYKYYELQIFKPLDYAWAFYTLATQGYSGLISSTWAYKVADNGRKIAATSKRESFVKDYADRLENVHLECTDALKVISSRDHINAFHYCDPSYYNANMGHYDGYSLRDFTDLLEVLAGVKGKFLLSSYPSKVLDEHIARNGWHTLSIQQKVHAGHYAKKKRDKIEVLTANYPLKTSKLPQKVQGTYMQYTSPQVTMFGKGERSG